MRGLLAGALALIALQWLTSSTLPGLAGAAAYPAQLVAKWMDPAVPLISAPAAGTTSTAPPPPPPPPAPGGTVANSQGQATAGLTTPPYMGGR